MRVFWIVIIILSSHVGECATWTVHGCKDNNSWMSWYNPSNTEFWESEWDFEWDTAFPNLADSGLTHNFGLYVQGPWTGYSDVVTIDIPDGVKVWDCGINGGWPDWGGGEDQVTPLTDWITPGEWWVDFASDGRIRILNYEPSDFGKWAWNGSINLNYVAPPTKTKGHKKH